MRTHHHAPLRTMLPLGLVAALVLCVAGCSPDDEMMIEEFFLDFGRALLAAWLF